MVSRSADPYFNLALEEYFLRQGDKEFFILWQSDPAVVVGKHQNALAEVNYRFLREKNIHLARRLSGGGTVFHGPGNLNFSFIMNGETGKLVDFNRFISPVIQYLHTLGIKAYHGPANGIMVNGSKISGNAEHVHKNRILHHGTLLFNADLSILREAIRVTPGKYVDKAVQSNRTGVINLADILSGPPDPVAFRNSFMEYIRDNFNGSHFQPDEKDLVAIRELAISKYHAREWILGWSPDYAFRGQADFPAGSLEISLKTHRGIIRECTLVSDQVPADSMIRLRNRLMGISHDADSLISVIRESGITECSSEECLQDAVYGFF